MNQNRIDRWKNFLSNTRLGETPSDIAIVEGRTKFDQDYDRIVFSSAFRRLQDKTQVFPLSQSDYTRTRLTHSIEVSCVGRSLGQMTGKLLQEQGILEGTDISYSDIGTIVAAACLAHDTGNPPFGHSGENAIQTWAKSKFNESPKLITSVQEREDFLKFEGNAQSFRIYSKLQGRERYGGLRLTLATIGALTKYPCHSINNNTSKDNVAFKKFGYFKDDTQLAQEAFKNLGLIEQCSGSYQRHPLAFLMEAADDICYAIIDIEDAFRLGIIPYKKVEEILFPIASEARISPIEINTPDLTKVARLRAIAIQQLTMECMEIFRTNLEEIENGNFISSLISQTQSREKYKQLKDLVKKDVYTNERVLQIEYVGFEAIGGLMEMYYSAILLDNPTPKEKKLRQLFPIQQLQFKDRQYDTHEECLNVLSEYQKLLSVTDYISGMTDSYAIDLYQKLSGIKLPS